MIATTFSGASKQTLTHAAGSDRAYALASLARQALLAEVELTPKPGLVDRRGSGAHADLSIEMMRLSALTLEPYFMRMAQSSIDQLPSQSLFDELKIIGRCAEKAMFHVTGGINTHKGAIWSLGLLVVGAAIQSHSNCNAQSITSAAGSMASFKNDTVASITHGKDVERRFNVLGARGEAQQGFPRVRESGLQTLSRRRREGAAEVVARLDCLLSIMAQLDDTCLLYRGGTTALALAQVGASAVLSAGGVGSPLGLRRYFELDSALLERGFSPGGSADLLAATIFVDALERNASTIDSTYMALEA